MQDQAIARRQFDRLHRLHMRGIDPRHRTEQITCVMRVQVEGVIVARIAIAAYAGDGVFAVVRERREVDQLSGKLRGERLVESRFLTVFIEIEQRAPAFLGDHRVVVQSVGRCQHRTRIGETALIKRGERAGRQFHRFDGIGRVAVRHAHIEFAVVAVEADRHHLDAGCGGVVEHRPRCAARWARPHFDAGEIVVGVGHAHLSGVVGEQARVAHRRIAQVHAASVAHVEPLR